MPYGVEAIPAHIAPDTTTVTTVPRCGWIAGGHLFVNLYKPEVRPKYDMEALSLHEAVPGHHLQIAMSHELGRVAKLSPLRRIHRLYRRLGFVWPKVWEMSWDSYKDPYSALRRYTYEMWRAVRLVVDTGCTTSGGLASNRIEFFASNTAKSLLDIENEVDRYIAWPGQALAYKIGELKIQELRRRATEKLGDRFDLRAFHT